jgi:hypothetical protein
MFKALTLEETHAMLQYGFAISPCPANSHWMNRDALIKEQAFWHRKAIFTLHQSNAPSGRNQGRCCRSSLSAHLRRGIFSR